jgi:hypothetical protein
MNMVDPCWELMTIESLNNIHYVMEQKDEVKSNNDGTQATTHSTMEEDNR